jgi:hypothetical protein
MPCIGKGSGYDENMLGGGDTEGSGNPLATVNAIGALGMPFLLQIFSEMQ